MPGPRVSRALARLLLPRADREVVIGDLEELHAARSRRDGPSAADRRYAMDALVSVVARRLKPSGSRLRLPRPKNPRDPILAGLWFDLIEGMRSLRRKPAFAAVAALTLALGVGATTVAFALVNHVLLKPLPGVRHPEEAAYVQFAPLGLSGGISYPDFELLRHDATLVEGMGSYAFTSENLRLGNARPVEALANGVEGDFFEVLGVRPALGRLLVPSDGDVSGDPLVAVISERLWGSLFGRAPDVIGKRLDVGDRSLTIVGVAGGGFAGPERGTRTDLWLPWPAMWILSGAPLDRMMGRQSTGHGSLVVRPRSGVTLEAVAAQLTASLARIGASVPESAEHLSHVRPVVLPGLNVRPLFRESTYRSITVLGGVVGLVLLIACANVANLLLFRGVGRRGEVATRRALGASAGRIARQHMFESLAVAGLGTLLGLGVGWLLGFPLRGFNLPRTPSFEGVAFDVRFLFFAGAIILLTTILFGAVPAVLAGASDPGRALSDAGARETGRGSMLRSGMAATQLALSMALLVGAFLLVRTLGNLYASDTGISYERVASINLNLDPIPVDEQDAVHRALISAVEAVPGVQGAAFDLAGPFSGIFSTGRVLLPGTADTLRTRAIMTRVSPEWFDVLGVRPVSGSTFRSEDWEPGVPPRVVLTQGLARKLFGTEAVVGRHLAAGMGQPMDAEIVGVIRDLRLGGPGDELREVILLPFAPGRFAYQVTLLVRTEALDGRMLAEITAAVERALPDLPVPAAVPLKSRIDSRLAEQRLYARMSSPYTMMPSPA